MMDVAANRELWPRWALAALIVLASVWATAGDVRAGGAHHLLEALDPPKEVASRAVTMTENFELVILVDRSRTIVFLDDVVTNAAVEGATVELDADGVIVDLSEIAPGIYSTTTWLPRPGINGLVFSVSADGVDDLLIVDLTIDDSDVLVGGSMPDLTSASSGNWTDAFKGTGRIISLLLISGGVLIALSVLLAGLLPKSALRWLSSLRPGPDTPRPQD